ncbi:MAG: DUF262 domain-containing protein [Saprospiraceae bacterium]
MSNQIKIVPKVSRLIHLIDRMEKGEIKIPSFQRDYVWTKKQREELFESIQLEYPIGAILLWRPEKEFKINHRLGPVIVNKTSNSFFYILDGFQRLSTIYGCLINPEKTKNEIDEEVKKEFSLYYDLVNQEFNSPRTEPVEDTNIPIYLLIDTFGYLDFSEKLRQNYLDKEYANRLISRGRKLSSTLIDYQIPYVEIYGGDIEKAVNIFSRVNSKGSPISKDWMVSALTSNEAKDFNLGELIENLLDDLKLYNFQDLKREVILQCIQSAFGKLYYDIAIEDLIKRTDFIEKTRKTIRSIKDAVKFLFEELYVLERRLLPYSNQLVFISYFFNEVDKNATIYPSQIKELKKWFWTTSYVNYFTIYSISKRRKAFEQFKLFVAGRLENSVFNDKPTDVFFVADLPEKIFFGSVRSTTLVLFMLNYAYDFQKNNAEEIDGINLDYLFPKDKSPGNFIPTIKYSSGKKNDFLPTGKHKNLSFLLYKENFKSAFNKLFLEEYMIGETNIEVLELREAKIYGAEIKFIGDLLEGN